MDVNTSFTLPETNVAPENRQSEKEHSLPTIHFQMLCWFPGVTSLQKWTARPWQLDGSRVTFKGAKLLNSGGWQ